MLSYLLAVLAACANATSSVLQRTANREVPRQENLSWKLVWSLAHEPERAAMAARGRARVLRGAFRNADVLEGLLAELP